MSFYDDDADHLSGSWSSEADNTTYDPDEEPTYRSVDVSALSLPVERSMTLNAAAATCAPSAAAELYDPDADAGFYQHGYGYGDAMLPAAMPTLLRHTAAKAEARAPPPLAHTMTADDVALELEEEEELRVPDLPAAPFTLERTHLVCQPGVGADAAKAALDACLLGDGRARAVEGIMIEVDSLFDAAKFKYKCSVSGDGDRATSSGQGQSGAAAPLPCLGAALAATPLFFVARVYHDATRDRHVIEFQRRRGSGVVFQRLFGALARSAVLAPIVEPALAPAAAERSRPRAVPPPAPPTLNGDGDDDDDGCAPMREMLLAGGECGVAAAALSAVAARGSSAAARAQLKHGVAQALATRLQDLCAEQEAHSHGSSSGSSDSGRVGVALAAPASADIAVYARAMAAIAEGTAVDRAVAERLALHLRRAIITSGSGDGAMPMPRSCGWEHLHERQATRQCERALKALGCCC